mmetsp:Transcript_24624/g.33790  ORF Transcript_24624/g.33790 Transcript_24624/m.33790 type:complete len:227 (-) Transcript_24624:891-1571(-)
MAVAVRLLQLCGRDPGGPLRGDGLAGQIQHFPRILVSLQLSECQPHLHRVGHALHGPRQHDARIRHVLQLDGRLPELDRVGHELQRAPQHGLLARLLLLQFRGLQPHLDRGGDVQHGVGQDGLGHLHRVQAGGLQPHVLRVRTHLAALQDDLAGLRRLGGIFLYTGRRDPARAVLGVGGGHGLQQDARFLDVAHLRLAVHLEAVEAGEVSLGVHHRLAAHRVGHLV